MALLAPLSSPGKSLKSTMPPKTRAVPSQWTGEKGFWKYQIEKSRDRNFLTVGVEVMVEGWR